MAAAISPRCRASLPSLPIRSRVSARSRWVTLAPGGGGISVRQEYARGLLVRDQVGHLPGDHQAGVGVCLEPLPGVVDRRLQQLLQREGAEQLVGAAHAGRDPRHARRAVSDGVGAVFDLVYPVALHRLADDTEHIGGRAPGGAVTVVDGDAAPLRGHVDDHLAVAGNRRVPRLDHVEAEAGGDGGVHGVSAALKDVDADLGGDRVRGGDGAVLDDDLVPVRTPDAAYVQRPISPSTTWAALCPGAPVTSPPGCVPAPHR